MAQIMKFEFSGGNVFYADFLEDLAPETINAVKAALPMEKTISHVKWSGHVISVLSGIVFKKAECSRSFGVVPGDILYNPHITDCPEHPYEIGIVYGCAAMRNVAGFAPHNLFARIRPEYIKDLYDLGIAINRNGQQTVKISLCEE